MQAEHRTQSPIVANPFRLIAEDCEVAMKTCRICKQEKDINLFYTGHARCKECYNKITKEHLQKVGRKYDFSEKGVITQIYGAQKRHTKLRGHDDVAYTKAELTSWLYENNFKALYDDWVSCGHTKDSKPSVDRLDDFKGYDFSNIKLGTWKQNHDHNISNQALGIGKGALKCKPLAQYLTCGKLKAIHVSYNAAMRNIGYQVQRQIHKGTVCRQGYYWRYV
jgi:hypothetical protein